MMVCGHEQLIDKISKEIAELGRIPFSRFMEMYLYDDEYGYYMTDTHPSCHVQGTRSRIGWQGDFFTAPQVCSIFAKTLVRQVIEVDELLQCPKQFHVLEMGCGDGRLARDFLLECARCAPALFQRLTYTLIDRSPMMVEEQRRHLSPLIEQGVSLSWAWTLDDLGEGAVRGVVLSNELVDAFPVHRVRMVDGQLQELYVDCIEGEFVESCGTPSTSEIEKYFEVLGVQLPEGFTTEVNLEALHWIREVSRVLSEGVVLTIDYGHTAQDYFSSSRHQGTLLCYSRHSVNADPYRQIGFQDMTAHVNFTSLAMTGEAVGLSVTGFTDLMHFLLGLDIEQMASGFSQDSTEMQAATQLLNPKGMGRTFKILVQHKGLISPGLSGLRYRPFFEDTLFMPKVLGS